MYVFQCILSIRYSVLVCPSSTRLSTENSPVFPTKPKSLIYYFQKMDPFQIKKDFNFLLRTVLIPIGWILYASTFPRPIKIFKPPQFQAFSEPFIQRSICEHHVVRYNFHTPSRNGKVGNAKIKYFLPLLRVFFLHYLQTLPFTLPQRRGKKWRMEYNIS